MVNHQTWLNQIILQELLLQVYESTQDQIFRRLLIFMFSLTHYLYKFEQQVEFFNLKAYEFDN